MAGELICSIIKAIPATKVTEIAHDFDYRDHHSKWRSENNSSTHLSVSFLAILGYYLASLLKVSRCLAEQNLSALSNVNNKRSSIVVNSNRLFLFRKNQARGRSGQEGWRGGCPRRLIAAQNQQNFLSFIEKLFRAPLK